LILFDGVHLASTESMDELHEMASRIGLRRSWIHDDDKHPHYDIKPGVMMRNVQSLIDEGEIERCSPRELVMRCFRGG